MRQGDEGDRAFVLLARTPPGRARGRRRHVVRRPATSPSVRRWARWRSTPARSGGATVRGPRQACSSGCHGRPSERLLAARPEAMRHVITVQVARVQRARRDAGCARADQHRDRAPGRRRRRRRARRGRCVLPAALGRARRVRAGRTPRRRAARRAACIARAWPMSAEDAPDAPRLLMWLDELERAARFVVYETSRVIGWLARSYQPGGRRHPARPRRRRSGRHRDRASCPREEETTAPRSRMLVLLHDDEALPSRTAAWLAPRTIARHLHVRLSRPDEVGRVARFIAGRAVGLVLGAGGARGFAHVGVMRAPGGRHPASTWSAGRAWARPCRRSTRWAGRRNGSSRRPTRSGTAGARTWSTWPVLYRSCRAGAAAQCGEMM